MDAGQVAVGLGLTAYGAAFFGACWWYAGDDKRLIRMAQRRWWLDRRLTRRIRTGQLSRDAWFAEFARRQRFVVRRLFPVFFVLWFAATLTTAVNGFRS